MKIFYDHLVIREDISKELRNYNLTVEEHIEILKSSDEMIHLEVLDVILTSLPKEKHHEFLEKMHAAPQDKKLLEYVSLEVQEEIKTRADKVKKQILSEIKRSQKK